MSKRDARIDAYINKSADFAKSVLKHFRELVHKTCPGVEETMKWNFPHFNYKGAMMCSMASFKAHCSIGFWKAALMKDAEELLAMARSETAMGHLGRITSLNDLPKDAALTRYIKDAMLLNETGAKLPAKITAIKELTVPAYFKKALKANKKALAQFEAFPYSHKKEYVEWITEAKTDATRQKRIDTTLEWLSEGKGRNWKYSKKL